MYSNTAASPRPEISAFLEESRGAETGLIAKQVLPVVVLDRRNGTYPKVRRGKGELMNLSPVDTRRAQDGSYPENNRAFEWADYSCLEYGIEERIDDSRKEEYKNFFDLEVFTSKLNRRSMLLDYEKRVADKLTDYTTMGITPTAAAVAYTESNLETIDFPLDIQAAQERLQKRGESANTLVLNLTLLNLLRRSKLLQGFLFGRMDSGTYKIINGGDLAKPFGIENILVASGAYNTAGKTTVGTFTGDYFWSNAYMWLMNVQSGDFNNGGAGRTIVWGPDCPGGLFTTETYRDEKRRGDMVRCRMNTDESIVDIGSIEMIATSYSAS